VAIRAVIFDVGSLLVHEEPVDRLLERWHDRSGVPLEHLLEVVAAIDPVATATGTLGERDVADGLAREFDLTDEQVAGWMEDLWDWYCGTSNEVVRDYARRLRPTVITAILSNSMDGARREEARRLGFADDFDPIVYSHEVGMAKPDPGLFRYTLDAIGCAPDEAAFVDDRMENVEAAAALGIRAIHHVDTVSTLTALDRLLDRG
jgi:putative hydrolase of the HAD superfamily